MRRAFAIVLLGITGCAAPGPADPPASAADTISVRVIPAPPAEVLVGLFKAVSDSRGFGATLEQSLASSSRAVVNGETVSTAIETETLSCKGRPFDLTPMPFWEALCAKGGKVNRYHVVFPSEDEARFSLYLDEALQLAKSLSLPLDDATQAFDEAWTGHFPRTERVYSFARPGQVLMTIHAPLGGPKRPAVRYVIVYARVG